MVGRGCEHQLTRNLLEYVCLLSLGLMTHSFKHTRFVIGIDLLN